MNDLVATAREAVAYPAVRALLVVVVSLLAAKLVEMVLCRIVLRLTRHTKTDLDDRLVAILRRPIFLSVILIGLFVALQMLAPGPGLSFWTGALIKSVAIFVWAGAGLRLISALLDGITRVANRVHWLDSRTIPLIDNVAKIVIVGGAVYGLLLSWDLNVGPWLASAGIMGIALGFAAKDTLANLFGGLFIIIDAPYQIGDYINLDSGERGRVTKIGLRSTRLLTRDDIEITLPNNQVANAKIVNESGGKWVKSRIAIDVGVAYGSDIDHVREVLTRAARSVPLALDDPEPRIRFMEMGDSALIHRIQVWIEEPALRGQCVDALNTAVYKALNAEKISIPFPQRDIHIKQPLPASTLE